MAHEPRTVWRGPSILTTRGWGFHRSSSRRTIIACWDSLRWKLGAGCARNPMIEERHPVADFATSLSRNLRQDVGRHSSQLLLGRPSPPCAARNSLSMNPPQRNSPSRPYSRPDKQMRQRSPLPRKIFLRGMRRKWGLAVQSSSRDCQRVPSDPRNPLKSRFPWHCEQQPRCQLVRGTAEMVLGGAPRPEFTSACPARVAGTCGRTSRKNLKLGAGCARNRMIEERHPVADFATWKSRNLRQDVGRHGSQLLLGRSSPPCAARTSLSMNPPQRNSPSRPYSRPDKQIRERSPLPRKIFFAAREEIGD